MKISSINEKFHIIFQRSKNEEMLEHRIQTAVINEIIIALKILYSIDADMKMINVRRKIQNNNLTSEIVIKSS